jgi:hypothetical protein
MEAATELPTTERAAPEPMAAPEAAGFEQTVLTALQQLTASLAGLADRVEAVEHQGPKFVPATPETYAADGERYEIAEQAPADGVPRMQKIPMLANGQLLPSFVMRQYAPKFRPGMRVRFNPDAVPHGRDDGKTRGELLAAAGIPNPVGEVIDYQFLSDPHGVWKVRVKFPNKALPGSNGGGISLHERELVRA